MWTTIALLTALGTTPAQADLSLTNVRSTHGLLGPERSNDSLSPGDLLFVSFDIDGITVDEGGKVKYSLALDLTDSGGKTVFKQAPQNLEAVISLGGNRAPAYAHLSVGLDTPPGDYQLKITVKDLASGKQQSLTRNFKVLPRDFALVRLAVSTDLEGRYPAAVFACGQGVLVHCSAVGFDRDRTSKLPNVVFQMRVLDDSGKPTLARPAIGTLKKEELDPKQSGLEMGFPLSLNRPGKFMVELTATDQFSGKKAKASFPITVQSVQK